MERKVPVKNELAMWMIWKKKTSFVGSKESASEERASRVNDLKKKKTAL